MLKLIAIAKIFYMCNTIKLLPFLIEAGRLDNWIEFLVAILDNPPDASYCTMTEDLNQIEQLDKTDYWTLKSICCKISVKLY